MFASSVWGPRRNTSSRKINQYKEVFAYKYKIVGSIRSTHAGFFLIFVKFIRILLFFIMSSLCLVLLLLRYRRTSLGYIVSSGPVWTHSEVRPCLKNKTNTHHHQQQQLHNLGKMILRNLLGLGNKISIQPCIIESSVQLFM